MKVFVALVVLAAAVNAGLVCQPNSRFLWMNSALVLKSPFANYTSPNDKCCDAVNPATPINFDVECHLCYGRTKSTPGFMLDPNNCQKFFMCVPTGNNGFVAHSMTCPDCMFWDDNKLSCVEVDTSCRVSVSVPTGTPNPDFTHVPLVSCIDFENVNDLSSKGMYVFNNGVTIVKNGENGVAVDFCPEGKQCGFFNASQLEIPFFSNNYNHLPNLKITFKMFSTSVNSLLEGVISNDCLNNVSGVSGNSFVYTVEGGQSTSAIECANGNTANTGPVTTANGGWVDVEIIFTGKSLTLTTSQSSVTVDILAPYVGLRESHCPLVIGSLIKEATTTFFQGYLDDICFSIDYEYKTPA